MVSVKTKGEIIYETVKLAVMDEGRVFLEARTDVISQLIFARQVRSYVMVPPFPCCGLSVGS